MQYFLRIMQMCLAISLLGGCAVHNPKIWEPAKFPKATPATSKLQSLPPAGQKVAVAVYGFTDQTGQFKPTDGAQTLSRAVTQGATSILVKSLHEAGKRSWFTVIEREKLDNVLRERAVIREMRSSYLGEKTINPQALPPLLFAGVLFEGGIIGYDSNTKSGGSGARFLGIGGQTQYREDTVTVYLRAVSVKTGEVLSSVSMRKSIASMAVGGSAFRYVAFKELVELEAGITYNEPDQLALQQAIEATVFALIMEGAIQDLWCFNASAEKGQSLIRDYISERDSVSKAEVVLPNAASGQAVTGTCQPSKTARNGRQTAARSNASQQIGTIAGPAAVKPVPAVQPASRQSPVAAAPIVQQPEKTRQSVPAQSRQSVPETVRPSRQVGAVAPSSQKPEMAVTSGPAPSSGQALKPSAQMRADPKSPAAASALAGPAAIMAEKPATKSLENARDTPEVAAAFTDCATVYLAREPLPEGYVPSVKAPADCQKKATRTASIEAAIMSVMAVTQPPAKPELSSDRSSLKEREMAGMD